jgi:hypothetical protein
LRIVLTDAERLLLRLRKGPRECAAGRRGGAAEKRDISDQLRSNVIATHVKEAVHIHPGSGEGLARIFKGRKDEPPEPRAHLQVNDVATLEALAGRQGHTLVGQLLGAYMGQPLGFNNNSKDTSTPVPAHTYRLCLSIGVQPDNAGFFLSREKDGLPQRFLWLPTTDRYAPEIRPQPAAPLHIQLPLFPVMTTTGSRWTSLTMSATRFGATAGRSSPEQKTSIRSTVTSS